uniref:TOX high mobility group box family member 3 n=1 Tax=Cacopsylla melanoneura TaxID=428564 RepID=A0A8D9F3Z7_9HEMI
MEATYCIGNDVDVCRMFDQYLYKRSENLDLSLSVAHGLHNNHHHYSHLNNNNMNHHSENGDPATFHTPSFGDEDFDIPQIHPLHGQNQPQPQAYHNSMSMESMNHHSPDSMNMSSYQPHYSNLSSQHSMNISNSYHQSPPPPPHHPTYTQLYYNMAPPQQRSSPTMHNMDSQPSNTQAVPNMTRLNNSTSNSNTSNLHTSDDSDDSTPHLNMMNSLKRPSPEPVESLPKVQTKKPKAQKKKKKKDPNEPQKPVSAYALFFRDTQAAIKGQNPNASFGEVSKIVASMWDSLDADHKNVYKKKTEAAKKDYLKALAAYRASLVSQGAGEGGDQSMFNPGGVAGGGGGGGGGTNSPYPNYVPPTPGTGGAYSGYSPPNNMSSPPLHPAQVGGPKTPMSPLSLQQQQQNTTPDPNTYSSQQILNNHLSPQQASQQQQQQVQSQQQISMNNNSYIHQVPPHQMPRGGYY